MTYEVKLTDVAKQENRKSPRMQTNGDVLIYKENLIVKAHSKNLSESGIYVETDGLLFPKNTNVKLKFLNEPTNEKKISAKVARRTLQGLGIVFSDTRH